MKIPKPPKKTHRASKGVYLNDVASNVYRIDWQVTDEGTAEHELALFETRMVAAMRARTRREKELDQVAAKVHDATEVVEKVEELTRLVIERVKASEVIDDNVRNDLGPVVEAS